MTEESWAQRDVRSWVPAELIARTAHESNMTEDEVVEVIATASREAEASCKRTFEDWHRYLFYEVLGAAIFHFPEEAAIDAVRFAYQAAREMPQPSDGEPVA